MSLDITKLEHVRAQGGKMTAQCPACAEAGHDQTRNHLIIQADGRFGCVVYPGDSTDARAHRKRIFALCGDHKIEPLAVRGSPLGRLGRAAETHSAGAPLKTDLLGRLGRLFQTHSGPELIHAGNEARMIEKLNDFGRGVLAVPSTPTVKSHEPELRSVLGLRFCMVYSELLGETVFFCEDEVTKAALVEAGADEWSIYTRDELRILVAQNRAKPFLPDELCKLHEAKKTFRSRVATDNGG